MSSTSPCKNAVFGSKLWKLGKFNTFSWMLLFEIFDRALSGSTKLNVFEHVPACVHSSQKQNLFSRHHSTWAITLKKGNKINSSPSYGMTRPRIRTREYSFILNELLGFPEHEIRCSELILYQPTHWQNCQDLDLYTSLWNFSFNCSMISLSPAFSPIVEPYPSVQ